MPRNEDLLRLQHVFRLNDSLRVELPIMSDLCVHIVDQERLSEVKLVVGERHCFEVQGHHCPRLYISHFVESSGGVAVHVEEFRNGSAVFREQLIVSSCIPLLVVIHHVIGCGGEELLNFLIGKNGIENLHFVNSWLCGSIPDSGGGEESEAEQVDFPEEGLMSHHEAEGAISNQGPGPPVI